VPVGFFECLELTRAFAVPHVCDCEAIWRLMVLGAERLRAGASAFRRVAEGGGVILGVRVCDMVVTPCDLRSLEITRPRINSILLLCLDRVLEFTW